MQSANGGSAGAVNGGIAVERRMQSANGRLAGPAGAVNGGNRSRDACKVPTEGLMGLGVVGAGVGWRLS